MRTDPPDKIDPYDAVLVAPFGSVGIVADERAVTGIHFLPAGTPSRAPRKNTLAQLACVQLMSYFNNAKFRFDLPVRLAGSKHQLDVWQAMRDIKPGRTRTYSEVAHTIHSSARAVGSACGKNPVPIVVPCHRIVAANGLGGFMGTRDENARDNPLIIKRWLLTHEGALATSATLL